ncbi:phosphoserine phosphatase SerB [Myxococcus sp. MISCRS1]|uniref:phosphoserine phosphatase SerB n=1 Tax=unclassified Myxococcus TaxID=2648731 RepID=UPI001CC02448|nr:MULTISPECIES: phosphoserine phosphatase SerB [unclassified Myxococcus]MBZ4407729.1 phosphoserine phosphatase SerB [Myxococcus sp. XM-1-1-1]MCY0998441.1 phosphoserine phosphatase SerB [Myxococcus sp. MISCRS1]
MTSTAPGCVLVTVTGKDHPGITARLTGLLADAGAELLDVEQVVVQGRLTLCLLVRLPESVGIPRALLFAARELGVALDFQAVETPDPGAPMPARYVVTAVGRALGAGQLHSLTSHLAQAGANVERIVRLSEPHLGSMELHVTLPPALEPQVLKRSLLALSMRDNTFDVALQKESLFRRGKRMVVMDMDSTLIRIEVIDELARAHGVGEQVSRITERAMQGEMDYDESLRQRVALLKGLDVDVLHRLAANLPLTEGAETLVRVLKRLGYRTAVISGGFSVAAEALKGRLGIDHAYSNVLEEEGGRLTGRTVGAIVNARRKAELLEQLAAQEGILLEQVIAVGDGANDLLMLERAGLGIAFRAKPRLREAADTSISAGGLDTILYLLGLTGRELQEAG